MRIAVFENEYPSVSGAFNAASCLFFDGALDIKVFPSSQSATLQDVVEYDVIFVDIDLASKSEVDGYTLISLLQKLQQSINSKIVILTGNNLIKEALDMKKIDSEGIQIIIKPTSFNEVGQAIKNVLCG